MDIHLKTDAVEELKGLMAEDGWTGSVKDYAREVFLEGMSYHKARQAGDICTRRKSDGAAGKTEGPGPADRPRAFLGYSIRGLPQPVP